MQDEPIRLSGGVPSPVVNVDRRKGHNNDSFVDTVPDSGQRDARSSPLALQAV